MKVLVAAVACAPYSGSELSFGWEAVMAMSREHELWVVTHADCREAIERAMAAGAVPTNLHFHYVGQLRTWPGNRLLAKILSWTSYGTWCRAAEIAARELHRAMRFDVAHHVTYSTWRVASPLQSLGIPLVWGPIGGGESFPLRFLPMLSPSAIFFEFARLLSNWVSTFSPTVRRCSRRAAVVFAANLETEQKLRFLRGSSRGLDRLCASFFNATRVAQFSRGEAKAASPDGVLRIFAGGNLEGRKGVALALRALAFAKEQGLRFRYRLGGIGPESAHLRRLAETLGLANDVIFGDSLHGDAYGQELQGSDVYLLPSLRDSAGITLMEAMLAGCVPVVADCGGPGEIVTPECGFAVPVTNASEMVARLAEILLGLQADREQRLRLGEAAARRIRDGFTDERYRQRMNAAYREAVQGSRPEAFSRER